jgi:hypothetical protein
MRKFLFIVVCMLPLVACAQQTEEQEADALVADGYICDLNKALALYQKVGATAKAERLEAKMDSLYHRHIYMAERYLASGAKSEFDPCDFMESLDYALMIKPESSKPAELMGRYLELPD